jgi:glycosyltransferase involved in cell wall biosynthesis
MAKINIGLPVYNGEKYLEQAINSLLNQTFRDFDLIICDNASTDRTQDICKSAAARDLRVRYFRNSTNLGAAPNFNRCLELATAQYFKWAAHDDMCLPEYLERCIDVLDSSPDVVACHSGTQFVDEHGSVLSGYDMEDGKFDNPDPVVRFANAIYEKHWCITIFSLIRRDALLKTSKIESYIGSDRSVIAQLALQGSIVHIPQVLFLSRDHGERSIRSMPVTERGEWFDRSRPDHGRHYWLRMLRAHTRVLFRFPMQLGQRIRGIGALIHWVRVNRRDIVQDMCACASRRLHSARSP